MPTYLYRCTSCDETTDGHFKLTETRPETVECILCGEEARYELSAPMVLKASYLDGQRKKKFQDLREASKLNKQAGEVNSTEERKALKTESKKIGYKLSNDPD